MSLKLFHVVESIDGKILDITTFVSHPTNVSGQNNEEATKKEAEKHFIDLINEHTIPVTLDDKSKKHWLDKRVYTNHSYKLELVDGYSKN